MEFVIPGCRPQPSARARGKTFHLTYAALYPNELNFDFVLDAAKEWTSTHHGLREYVIGRERHPQPADPARDEHFHVYFKAGKKLDITDRFHSTYFDLRGRAGRVLHPEIQSVLPTPADRERVINYDMKDGDFVGELETPLVNDRRRDREEAAAREEAQAAGGESDAAESEHERSTSEKSPAWARMLNKAHSTRDGMGLLAESAPHIFYMHGSRIKPMLMERVGTPEPKLFSMADFNRPALDLDQPVVVWGDTEMGKTEFVLAHFEKPLVVRRRDDLKRASYHDGIIFDDMDFAAWTPEDVICLLSQDKPRSLPARFHDAFIEADIPLVFTTNKKPKRLFPRADSRKQRRAIARRYTSVEVRRSLMRIGRPLTPIEKRARRAAGRRGPQGPGADAAERDLFGDDA